LTADPFVVTSETLDLSGRAVTVTQLTAAAMMGVQRAPADARIFAMVAGCTTVDGAPVTAEEVAAWPAPALNAILPTVLRLNGMDEAAEGQPETDTPDAVGNDQKTARRP